jgi:hypothetical protein
MHRSKGSPLSVPYALICFAGVVAASFVGGCGTPHLTYLTVAPGRTSIVLGDTAKFTVIANYSDGTTEDVTASAAWSTLNSSIATINAGGVASPVSVGTATIMANALGRSGTASLIISKAALTAISVTSPSAAIALGQSAQLQAQGTYSDKSVQDITDQVSWSAASPGIATISSTGLAVSKAIGNTQVTASLNNITASGQIAVSGAVLASIAVRSKDVSVPLGASEQFSAIGTYTDGSAMDLTSTATWVSSAPGVVSVNAAGKAATKAVGGASISAAVGGISGTTVFTVSPAALVSIAVAASNSSLPLGSKAQLTATATYTDTTTKDITGSVTWTSSAPGVVSVSGGGTVLAKGVGSAGISATSSNISGSTNLSVSTAALVSITVSASHSSLPLGTGEQLTATGTYTDSSTKDITGTVAWTSSAPGVVSVSSEGTVQAKGIGTAGISATSSNVTGKTNLSVSAATLVGISISASSASIPVGDTLQLSAVGTLTDGSTQDLTRSVNWASSAPQVLSVQGAGLVAGMAIGAAGVTAASGSITAVTTLNVSAPVLSSITLAPAGPTVPLGSSLQLTITGTYSDGSTQDVTQQASWNIDTPTIASITSGGVVSGLQVGTTGVEASINGVQTSDTVTVQPLLTVSYFDATSGIDSTIRITNPGTTGQDLCAMVYVFDQDQQMSECCGCLVSQDGLLTLSLKSDLLSNPLTGVASTSGTVMLVSGQQLGSGGCNASTVTPAGTVVAWVTHLPQSKSGALTSAEVPFSTSPLSTILSSSLQAQCSFIQQLGSGQGLCGCGNGQR